MTVAIPPGFGQAVITHAVPATGQTQLVTHGFINTTTGLFPNDIAQLIYEAWVGTSKPFQSSVISDATQAASVKITVNVTGSLLLGEFNSLTFGSRSSASPPPQVAVVVKKRTGFAGKAQRGRFYLPASFLTAAGVDQLGNIDGTLLAAIQGRLTGYLSQLAIDNVDMCLLHNDPLLDPTLVTELLAEQMIGTQRRRLR